MRAISRAAILAAVFACLAASPALAGTITYAGASNEVLVYTGGDNSSHDVQVRFIEATGRDEILDNQTIDSAPGDCSYEGTDSRVSCPGRPQLRIDLGSGNDSVTTGGSTGDCFDVHTINLGEGTNSAGLNEACPAGGTATITSGSGQDNLIGGAPNITFSAGGGDDTVHGGSGNDVIQGGDGADTVSGNNGNDQVFGEGGNDILRGGAGNDTEDGGPGDDDIGYSPGNHDDDQGADDVRGGAGTDRLRLDGHTGGMTISLDDQANDGAPGEGDNIHSDIEIIEGTGANDNFSGTPAHDDFDGGNGADTIHGNGGDDTLTGGSDGDQVFGDAGNDTLYGSYGDDLVDGGSGRDSVFGDLASCSGFSCPAGNDQLFIRDGELDQANCGAGADTVQADQLDVFAVDGFQACESVDRQTVAVPGAGAGAGAGPGSAAAALGLKVAGSIRSKALLKRGLVVQLKCAGACKILAELRYKSKKLGSARKTLLKAGPAKLVIKISKKARRTVRRLKRGKLTLRLKVTDAAGKTTSLTKTIKFRH